MKNVNMFEIGKVYNFNYESTSAKRKSKDVEKVKVRMSSTLMSDTIDYINESADKINSTFANKVLLTESVRNDELSKAEIEKEKELFYEKYPRGKAELTDEMKAKNLFFRNYNPANITEGDNIEAIFAGCDCTVNGKITYKWYVTSEISLEETKLKEEFSPFVDIIKGN